MCRDRDDSKMPSRPEVPTVYWQAIVTHNVVVLQMEGMSHLCESTVPGSIARRDNVLASKCECPPFRYPPFPCARILVTLSRVRRRLLSCSRALLLHISHRAGTARQQFGLVLRPGVHRSTSVLQARVRGTGSCLSCDVSQSRWTRTDSVVHIQFLQNLGSMFQCCTSS